MLICTTRAESKQNDKQAEATRIKLHQDLRRMRLNFARGGIEQTQLLKVCGARMRGVGSSVAKGSPRSLRVDIRKIDPGQRAKNIPCISLAETRLFGTEI